MKCLLLSIILAANLVSQSPHPPLTITHLTGDCYVYTTYGLVDGDRYPANSMYLVTGKGVVLFDVPWELCRLHHNDEAVHVFTKDTTFTIGNYSFRTFYPGAGHTKDNIVIWVPKARVLYAGCFIKSTEASDLGNLSDADPTVWPASVRRVMKEFPDPEFIIPGHLSWADKGSLLHTAKLLEEYKAGQ